jgi:adenylosuccinate lyase
MDLMPLTALSPLDGRYAQAAQPLREHLSEYGLIRRRIEVEIAWLAALADEPGIRELPPLPPGARARLEALVRDFSPAQAARVKALEAETNHDVKALEYFLAESLAGDTQLAPAVNFVHFACTSEDINNLAWALALARVRDGVLLPGLGRVEDALVALAHAHADVPMLARTHGQSATPTTLGKEMANFAARVRCARAEFAAVAIRGKANGAVGNYNAHRIAYPDVDWPALSRRFVERLGLTWNAHTTQIEPHDWIAAYCDALARANTVLLDLCRDVWGYVSFGYFRQRAKPGEVGSSTMPHKVNPIAFENAEGNLGIADALLGHLARKLPVSRFQRDLSDSTALRNLGPALGHGLVAWTSIERGLATLEVDRTALARDLDGAWEVLAEALQTVMRRHGVPQPYEQVKALTRGRRVDRETLAAFIESLPIPAAEKARLAALTPATYLGDAAALARGV